MNEEKKLPDETLEDVSGGLTQAKDLIGLKLFEKNNCGICSNNLPGHVCPYGGVVNAFQELGREGICPAKEEW